MTPHHLDYRILHQTVYRYSSPVADCYNMARLIPRNHGYQSCLSSYIYVTPPPAVLQTSLDFFGNSATFFNVQGKHQELEVKVESDVRVIPRECPRPSESVGWESAAQLFRGDISPRILEASEYTFESPLVQFDRDIQQYALESFSPGRPLLEGVLDLTARIHRDFEYAPQTTTVQTSVREIMELRKGVCQDFAHLQIACLRSLGLSARYVSGYLRTIPPPGQPRLVGADASHAWLSVFFPTYGWIDFDPTNNQVPSSDHITLAWGRDYNDVSPIRGAILGGGEQTIDVSVDVEPLTPVDGVSPTVTE